MKSPSSVGVSCSLSVGTSVSVGRGLVADVVGAGVYCTFPFFLVMASGSSVKTRSPCFVDLHVALADHVACLVSWGRLALVRKVAAI